MQLLHSPPLSARRRILFCALRACTTTTTTTIYTRCVCNVGRLKIRLGRHSCMRIAASAAAASHPTRYSARAVRRVCYARPPATIVPLTLAWNSAGQNARNAPGERVWRTSATAVVTFMTYEKHFEELRRPLAAARRENE